MLNPVKLWTDALKSGEYKQGKRRLKYEKDGQTYHCCLGVACELYSQYVEPLEEKIIDDGSEFHQLYQFNNEHISVLPPKVRDWLGLTEEHGEYYKGVGLHGALTQLNDEGQTFEEIAKVIEAKPIGLFKEEVVELVKS